MIVLLVIFLILLCLTALLLFPINLKLNFDGEFGGTLKYLCFKLKFPSKKRETAKKAEMPAKTKTTSGKKAKRTKPKHKLSYYIDEYKTPTLNILKQFHKLLQKIVVKELKVEIVVGDEDASKTAIEYGLICASVYPLLSAFENHFEVKSKTYNIETDFDASETKALAVIDFNLRPLYALATVLTLIYIFLKLKLNK